MVIIIVINTKHLRAFILALAEDLLDNQNGTDFIVKEGVAVIYQASHLQVTVHQTIVHQVTVCQVTVHQVDC